MFEYLVYSKFMRIRYHVITFILYYRMRGAAEDDKMKLSEAQK